MVTRKTSTNSDQQLPLVGAEPIPAPNGEDPSPVVVAQTQAQLSAEEQAALEREEADYRALSVDEDDPAPSIASLVIRIIKTPDKEQYFRTHPSFLLKLNLLQSRQGEAIDVAYLGVTKDMVEAMAELGMRPNLCRLYLTINRLQSVRLIPVRVDSDNSYTTTLREGLTLGMTVWTRVASDLEEQVYRNFPLPLNRYPEPIWPTDLTPAKAVSMVFRSRGRLIDTTQHPYYLKLKTGSPTPKGVSSEDPEATV
jgi:hypothetical protein